MNYLEIAPEDRPALESRERVEGFIEVRCPVCGNWRAGFLMEPFGSEAAERFGQAWGCDIERSTINREVVAAEESANPGPPTLNRAAFIALWLPIEAVTVMRSTDDLMLYFWTQVLAVDSLNLGNSRVAAGVAHAVSLNIITEARAARILAGLPPEA